MGFTLPQFVDTVGEQSRIDDASETRRNNALNSVIGALQSVDKRKAGDKRTKRQQGLQEMKAYSDIVKSTGSSITFDQYKNKLAEQDAKKADGPGFIRGMTDSLGFTEAEAAPVQDEQRQSLSDLLSQKTPEYLAKQQDIANKRTLTDLQIQEQRRQAKDAKLPFGEREEGLKFKSQEEFKQSAKDKVDLKKSFVPGLGYAQTPGDAKQLKESVEMKRKFDREIQELIDLRESKGGEFLDRNAVARGKQLSKKLLLTFKNLAKLGVLSQSDEAIVNAIIPGDPLAFTPGAAILGQDPILHQLKKFKGDLEDDYQTTLKTRLRQDPNEQQIISQQAIPNIAAPVEQPVANIEIQKMVQQYTPNQKMGRLQELRAKQQQSQVGGI